MAFRTKGDCYGVFRGRTPRIYPTWEAAEQQVTGFPGNLHRRYRSYEDGLNAWIDYFEGPPRAVQGHTGDVVMYNGLCGHSGGRLVEASFGRGNVAALEINHPPRVEMTTRALFPPGGFDSQPGSSAHASPATQPEFQHDFGDESVTIRQLVEALGSLETRVSQLEMEKSELFTKVGAIIEELSTVFNMKDQKN